MESAHNTSSCAFRYDMSGHMTVPSPRFVALVWPALFRGAMLIAFLWSAVQLTHLSIALSKGAPHVNGLTDI